LSDGGAGRCAAGALLIRVLIMLIASVPVFFICYIATKTLIADARVLEPQNDPKLNKP
jgi:hypothetical protein